ncbi:hypothetical protein VHUM_00624 [Vanrija humicola]|uniref:Kinesin-like protein n=1 Tax=Vanrija humicola TaxID=5417 RepID=A0A7D8ZW46_VANHU|nr:hypothetical protein VHUM_00624 [Vanrija humicola]
MEASSMLAPSEAVLVSVRVRPHNAAELRADTASAWVTPSYDQRMIKLAKGRDGNRDDREWIFDKILPPDTDNARAYATSARAHVRSAMEGFNAVIFAYGQTASGKTHTLTGQPDAPGIIPLAISDLFGQIRSTPDREFLLRASYLELYNEQIIDLLSPEVGKELSLSEGRKKGEVVINGLTECAVRTEEEIRRLLRMGEDRRKVGGTDWNQRSSRSHCVFRIVIESRTVADGTRTPGRDKTTRISTLSIIDLAGSEKHTSSKERNAEGRHINQSLLTLKLVISKLADMASKRNVMHVPYRDSKLTRLLQPSLSGDALISVICTVSPSPVNMAESISTLSFAQGLKRVLLSAQRKEVVDPEALIQQYQNEIAGLRALLQEKEQHPSSAPSKGDKSNAEMENRLNELKSLILTSTTIGDGDGDAGLRPLSPSRLKYPQLDFDKTSVALREELHAAELRVSQQEEEIARLKAELEVRPLNPDKRCMELQDEVNQLRMIAADYERHLREPSRKVREDVDREWQGKYSKLESQLESKTIWANRLDENVRHVTAQKRILDARCKDAEAKLMAVFEWVTAALSETDPADDDYDDDDEDDDSDDLRPLGGAPKRNPRISTDNDFGPNVTAEKLATLTLNASRMRRSGISNRDLQSEFQDWFKDSLSRPPKGKLLRDESVPVLASIDDNDDMF